MSVSKCEKLENGMIRETFVDGAVVDYWPFESIESEEETESEE